MVMVVTVRGRRLVACDPVASVDAFDQPQFRQCFEGAVDGGDPDRTARFPQPVEDLLGAQTTVLPAEQLDNGRARAAATEARGLERFVRIARPSHIRSVSSGCDFE